MNDSIKAKLEIILTADGVTVAQGVNPKLWSRVFSAILDDLSGFAHETPEPQPGEYR